MVACSSGAPKPEPESKVAAQGKSTKPSGKANTVEKPTQEVQGEVEYEPPPPPVVPVIEPDPGPLRFEPSIGPGGRLPYELPPAVEDAPDPSGESGGRLPDGLPPATEDARGEPTSAPGLSQQWKFGWTNDSETFAYCDVGEPSGGCHTRTVSGHGESLSPSQWSSFEQERGPLERGANTWRYGDLTVTYVREGTLLRVGGRTGADHPRGKADIEEFSFDSEWYFQTQGEVGLGVFSLSPDGDNAAVVVVGLTRTGHHETQIALLETGVFAGMVYAGQGQGEVKDGEFVAAAAWFARAGTVSTAWRHPYDEACARARGRADGVQAALTKAIEAGGVAAMAKAASDPDLSNVRREPWFEALVRPDRGGA